MRYFKRLFIVIGYGILGAIAGAMVGILASVFLFIALLAPWTLLKFLISNLKDDDFYYFVTIGSTGIGQLI